MLTKRDMLHLLVTTERESTRLHVLRTLKLLPSGYTEDQFNTDRATTEALCNSLFEEILK